MYYLRETQNEDYHEDIATVIQAESVKTELDRFDTIVDVSLAGFDFSAAQYIEFSL